MHFVHFDPPPLSAYFMLSVSATVRNRLNLFWVYVCLYVWFVSVKWLCSLSVYFRECVFYTSGRQSIDRDLPVDLCLHGRSPTLWTHWLSSCRRSAVCPGFIIVFLLWNICKSGRCTVAYCLVLLFIWVQGTCSRYVKTLCCSSSFSAEHDVELRSYIVCIVNMNRY